MTIWLRWSWPRKDIEDAKSALDDYKQNGGVTLEDLKAELGFE